MSERGVFAVDRGVFDHPLFDEEREFSRREAWLWLLAEAAWRPTKRRVSGVAMALARGQVAHSVRFMADAWGWHRAKVERFLALLKTETMIETAAETGVTVITICKYDEYQRVSLPDRDAIETAAETGPRQDRDRLEDKEYREDTSSLRSDVTRVPERATPRSELAAVLDDERAAAVVEHRQRIRKPLTARAAKLLAGKLARAPDPNEAADAMIANGWQGFEPEWLANRAANGRGPPGRSKPLSYYDIHQMLSDPNADDQPDHAGPTLDLLPAGPN